MKLKVISGLLLCPLTISHHGKSATLEYVIIDTGSVHTWINLDSVEDILDVGPEEGDQIITAFGIGGRDVANRKRIDQVQFDNFFAEKFRLDFGRLDIDIDGLIGLDLLTAGHFIINLAKMEVYREQ